jgi:hypothetical protein
MIKNTKILVTFMCMFLALSFVILADDFDKSPIPISPGSDLGVAKVEHSCPTFSWSGVAGATAYRIVIFNTVTEEVLPYEDMLVTAKPLMSTEIPGQALAWTPSADEGLGTGGFYVWYIQAVDSNGNSVGSWSKGKIFKVELTVRLAGIKERLRETLKEYGVDEDIINGTLEDLDSNVKEVNLRGEVSSNNNQAVVSPQGHESDSNTWFGKDAAGDDAILPTGAYNSFFGSVAGYKTTSGYANTFLGSGAGWANTEGDRNTFVGVDAGHKNETGNYNVFIGQNAGFNNTTAEVNTFIGYKAGYQNTTGKMNTFVGKGAGDNNTTGSFNTFLGYHAGYSNNPTEIYNGIYNTFIGHAAGYSNTTGGENVFIGNKAGFTNNTGGGNTFVGYKAGYTNDSTEYPSGKTNTFIGHLTGEKNTTGWDNTFIGAGSGRENTTGNNNTYLGTAAGLHSTTGSYNIFIGVYSGFSNKADGSNNIFLGPQAGMSNSNGSNNVFIGYSSGYYETDSNKLYIANSDTSEPLIYGEFDNNILTVHGKLGIGTKSPSTDIEISKSGSSATFKIIRTDGATFKLTAGANNVQIGAITNHGIKYLAGGSWKMQLNSNGNLYMRDGGSYDGTWNNASSRELKENIEPINSTEAFDTLENLEPVKYNYIKDKEERHAGFIAEDVPDLVATNSRKNISTMDIVAVLTKVVKEQQSKITEQEKVIKELIKRIDRIENR